MPHTQTEHQIEVLKGISYIISALDNTAPNTKEIESVYFCIMKNLKLLEGKKTIKNSQ